MKRHIILTNGRSGSNHLANTLNLHPHITNYGEVLGEWTLPYRLHKRFRLGGSTTAGYLDFIYSSKTFFYLAQLYSAYSHLRKRQPPRFKFRHRIKTLGIKDFFIKVRARNVESFLENDNELLVINLYRENVLKRYISVLFMERTGAVVATEKGKGKRPGIRVPLENIVEMLDVYQSETQGQLALADRLSPRRVFTLRYEDYFASDRAKAEYTEQLFTFLGVEPIPIQSSHKKILSPRLEDIVENYEELHERLRDTEHSQYLQDPENT